MSTRLPHPIRATLYHATKGQVPIVLGEFGLCPGSGPVPTAILTGAGEDAQFEVPLVVERLARIGKALITYGVTRGAAGMPLDNMVIPATIWGSAVLCDGMQIWPGTQADSVNLVLYQRTIFGPSLRLGLLLRAADVDSMGVAFLIHAETLGDAA